MEDKINESEVVKTVKEEYERQIKELKEQHAEELKQVRAEEEKKRVDIVKELMTGRKENKTKEQSKVDEDDEDKSYYQKLLEETKQKCNVKEKGEN